MQIFLSFSVLSFVAITKTLLTKYVFLSIPAPIGYSFLSCFVTLLCLLPVGSFGKINMIDKHNVNSILLASVSIGIDLAFTNISLYLISVPLQQCIKSLAPVITVMIETCFQMKIHHPCIYILIILVSIGPIIMVYDQVLTSTFSFNGVLSMLIAVTSTGVKNVFAHNTISDTKKEMGILSFTIWIELIVGFLLLPWAYETGEIDVLFKVSPEQVLLLLFTAFYGGVRILSQLYFLKFTSPTTLALTNITVQIFTTLFGVLLFNNECTFFMYVGIAVSLIFSSIYAICKYKKTFEKGSYPKKITCKIQNYQEIVPLTEESNH